MKILKVNLRYKVNITSTTMQDVIEIKKCFEFLVVGLAVMVLIALLRVLRMQLIKY